MAAMAAHRFVLASRSETRLRVLRQAGFDPVVAPSDVDESVGDLELSVAVSELALRKATAVAPDHHDDLVLGCDSLVALDGRVLGKPSSAEEAASWWRQMRRRSVPWPRIARSRSMRRPPSIWARWGACWRFTGPA